LFFFSTLLITYDSLLNSGICFVDAAYNRQVTKKWKPLQDKKYILAQMRQKLVDLRAVLLKRKAMAESQKNGSPKDGDEEK